MSASGSDAQRVTFEGSYNANPRVAADGKSMVFLRVPEGFKAQPVELGRRSNGRVEIAKGMTAGQAYAGQGSFTVKAEQGKAEASHTH